jgi:putative selenium metabolism protein SsnA
LTLVLAGATCVTRLDPPAVARADIVVADRRIAAIGADAGAESGARSGAGTRIDCSGCLVIPGNVCAHTHVYAALARGMPSTLEPPGSFLEILQRIWWRLDRALDESMIRASALVAGREALLAGTTTLVDHHASPNAIDGSLDVIAQALGELGIRSVLAYEVTDRDGPARARAGIGENRRFTSRVARGDLPLARAMVGAHASFTLGQDSMAEVADLARMTGTGVHIHIAEDAIDEADAVARFGRRVVERLAGDGALDGRSLLAHVVHVDPAEVELVRGSGATAVYNPRSNMNNGVGRAPLGWLGQSVALGTDGIGGDLFEEARSAYLRRREDEPESGVDWPMAALARSASVAGRLFAEPALGRLEAGAPADLVVLDYLPPTPVDARSLGGHWIFGFGSAAVRDVVVAGEPVVRDRRLVLVDEAEIADRARREAERLWERLAGIGPHPFNPSDLLATPIGGK